MIYISKQQSNETVESLLWEARKNYHLTANAKIPAGHAASTWCAQHNAEKAEQYRFAANYYAGVLEARQ